MSVAVIVALVFLTACSGAVFKPGAWYDSLQRPDWTPPDWAFPVVWTILYVMIACAGWIIWDRSGFSLPMIIWGLQLVLNAMWSGFFFGMKRMDLAFVDVCVLWLAIVVLIVTTWPISTLAAVLFVPYLAWVSTAGLLNWTVWRMNPGAAST